MGLPRRRLAEENLERSASAALARHARIPSRPASPALGHALHSAARARDPARALGPAPSAPSAPFARRARAAKPRPAMALFLVAVALYFAAYLRLATRHFP